MDATTKLVVELDSQIERYTQELNRLRHARSILADTRSTGKPYQHLHKADVNNRRSAAQAARWAKVRAEKEATAAAQVPVQEPLSESPEGFANTPAEITAMLATDQIDRGNAARTEPPTAINRAPKQKHLAKPAKRK